MRVYTAFQEGNYNTFKVPKPTSRPSKPPSTHLRCCYVTESFHDRTWQNMTIVSIQFKVYNEVRPDLT